MRLVSACATLPTVWTVSSVRRLRRVADSDPLRCIAFAFQCPISFKFVIVCIWVTATELGLFSEFFFMEFGYCCKFYYKAYGNVIIDTSYLVTGRHNVAETILELIIAFNIKFFILFILYGQ